MIDISVIIFIEVLLMLTMIGVLIVVYKYSQKLKLSLKEFFLKLNIISKVIWILLITLMISTQVFGIYALTKQDPISYHSGTIQDTLIVEDGIIVVGRATSEVREGNRVNMGSKAYIAKYDFDGHMIFENIYVPSDENSCYSTAFYQVEEKDGYYLASNASECMVKFDYSGNFIGTLIRQVNDNQIDLSNGFLRLSRTYNEDNQTYTFNFLLNHESFNYTYTPQQYYQGDARMHLLEEKDGRYIVSVVLGELPYSYYQYEGYNFLFEIDSNTSSIALLLETENYRLHDKISFGGKEYMISNNAYARSVHLLEIDEDYQILNETQVLGHKDYYLASDWFIEDNKLYMIGTEYETMRKEGFNEYYSSVINVFDDQLVSLKKMRLPQGTQVLTSQRDGHILYLGGRFNTAVGGSFLSNQQTYAWAGIYMVYDYINDDVLSYDYIDKQYRNLNNYN